MAKKKADLQAEAKALGVDFKAKDTVADLQAAIDAASGGPEPYEPDQTAIDRAKRRAAQRAEEAEAFHNRTVNEAEARVSVLSAAQQAVARKEAGE